MKKVTLIAGALCLGLCVQGCSGAKKSAFPATEVGAKAMLQQFLKADADRTKLSLALKPQSADYGKVFADAATAKKAEAAYSKLWESVPKRPFGPKEGQTEILLWGATTDDLKEGKGNASKFPGGYKKVAAQLKSGLKVYRFKFVKPGSTLGMAFDGLYNIEGRWVLMPKPWRALR
ncbi:MAG: hypothetical protein JRH20_19825 [Deltaproteobacteria bacterium]|nr:hypothetical protein [Deltaproteobacteria bacterium]